MFARFSGKPILLYGKESSMVTGPGFAELDLNAHAFSYVGRKVCGHCKTEARVHVVLQDGTQRYCAGGGRWNWNWCEVRGRDQCVLVSERGSHVHTEEKVDTHGCRLKSCPNVFSGLG